MNSFLEPYKDSYLLKILIAIAVFLFSLVTNAQIDRNTDLYKTLKAKDSIIFQRAFNKCELEKLEPIIAENFEFYHDLAGIQNRKEFMLAMKNNICGNPGRITRQLVAASLEVFPLKNNGVLYGAIQKGKHTFQEKNNTEIKTVGIADFTDLWILENNSWKLKRVLSYNHKPYKG
ncbi:nuclear transport factor 2 family protein [uncultured Polaribacter sp.]|uniref:nuclear transport factor 2 family protein n=1 Tax=uncultured Polaribacter sp. TaxID=174711 RepID=UPI002612AC53|nr:nuclear transport factor 2 family protein [uncultured Polaribacter sp.]